MVAPNRAHVIYFRSVAKFNLDPGRNSVILRPTTVTVLANQSVAIPAPGRSRQANSMLLQMIGGVEGPDEGEILTEASGSPVANARGLFHPGLTGAQNFRQIARMYGVDADQLMLAADQFNPVPDFWEHRVAGQDYRDRMAMEVAVGGGVAVRLLSRRQRGWAGQSDPRTLHRSGKGA